MKTRVMTAIKFISLHTIVYDLHHLYNWKTFACDLHYTLGTLKFVLLT